MLCAQSRPHIAQMIGRGIIGCIGHRHISIEKVQGFLLLWRGMQPVQTIEFLADEFHFCLKGRIHFGTIGGIGDEMLRCCQQGNKAQGQR